MSKMGRGAKFIRHGYYLGSTGGPNALIRQMCQAARNFKNRCVLCVPDRWLDIVLAHCSPPHKWTPDSTRQRIRAQTLEFQTRSRQQRRIYTWITQSFIPPVWCRNIVGKPDTKHATPGDIPRIQRLGVNRLPVEHHDWITWYAQCCLSSHWPAKQGARRANTVVE